MVDVLPDFCSCDMRCQQDYHNPDNNVLQDAYCGTTKHCARTLVQTNINKQIYITAELNLN